MGTTMSFFNILNKGFSPAKLQDKLANFPVSEPSEEEKMLQEFLAADLLEQMQEQTNPNADQIGTMPGEDDEQPRGIAIAYKESARWLPFYEESLCAGYIASSEDAEKLSEIFEAPVIAFSVFDSDILFVSYSDAANNITYDYAKANFEEMDDDPDSPYSTEFPEFLVEFCSRDELEAVWDEPDVIFADDRMFDIAKLIQAELIYDGDQIPEGYQGIATVS